MNKNRRAIILQEYYLFLFPVLRAMINQFFLFRHHCFFCKNRLSDQSTILTRAKNLFNIIFRPSFSVQNYVVSKNKILMLTLNIIYFYIDIIFVVFFLRLQVYKYIPKCGRSAFAFLLTQFFLQYLKQKDVCSPVTILSL